MPKAPHEITQKTREIYDLASAAETPINVLSLESTILLGKEDWLPEEVERMSGGVLDMLIRNGWTRKKSWEALKYGTKVVVTAAPARAGGDTALVLKIESETGEDLLSLGPVLPPPPPAAPAR